MDLQTALRAQEEAVNAFVRTASAVPANRWNEPRAPGKWSPRQITEHLALSYEAGRLVLQGGFKGVKPPRFVRPLIRKLFLDPVLRRGGFSLRAPAPKFLRPTGSPVPPETMINRMEAAAQAFERYASGSRLATIDHPFFGHLPLADFVRLQAIHTQHHRGQLPSGPT